MRGPFILIINERGELFFADDDVWEVLRLPSMKTYDLNKLSEQRLKAFLEKSAGTIELEGNEYRFVSKIAWESRTGQHMYLVKLYPPEDDLINFFSVLIHEFKNPLGAIRALAQSLEAKFKYTSEQREKVTAYTERIIKEIDRLNSFLDSIKYVSRPLKDTMKEFDLTKVVKEAIELYEEELTQRGIRIELIFETERVLFWGVPDDFHQILSNLIRNAEEAIEGVDDGRITVAIHATDEIVEIEVIDNGIGIDDEVLKKIGEKLFITTKLSGMGMGLYVVRNLLGKYDGDLSLSRGHQGRGTVAKVTLSLKKNQGFYIKNGESANV